MEVYIALEERQIADTFMALYQPFVYQGTAVNNLRESRRLKKSIQCCRFCKRNTGQTSFSQDTHLIPRLLGNSGFYSSDECDDCNQLFRLFENDLAAAMGNLRTFDHLREDTKAPMFESANGQIGARPLADGAVYLYKKKDNAPDFAVDIEKGTVSIRMDSQPYKPEFVYRALLKIALAILPEPLISLYESAFDFLLHPEKYPDLDWIKRVCVTGTDLVIARPFALIFEKRPAVNKLGLPQHLFCLYVGRLMFQFII